MFLEILLIIIIVAALACFFYYGAEVLQAPNLPGNSSSTVCLDNNCFNVELAKTPAQREKGLMNRENLDKDKGMLFIFDQEGIYPFWMKNTLISLDIIWIDSDNRIVFIGQNIQPCLPAQAGKSLICPSVIPNAKAKYVLEINAGMAKEIGLKPGDELKINLK